MAKNNKNLKNKKQKKPTPKPLTVKGAATFESKSVSVDEAIDFKDILATAIANVAGVAPERVTITSISAAGPSAKLTVIVYEIAPGSCVMTRANHARMLKMAKLEGVFRSSVMEHLKSTNTEEEEEGSWMDPPNAILHCVKFANGGEVWGVKYLNDDGDDVWGSEEEEQEFREMCEEAQNLQF
tara:strand:+ start:154 stop:702 length:549 start_codon:yes stop_codon:yes gene_type:complete